MVSSLIFHPWKKAHSFFRESDRYGAFQLFLFGFYFAQPIERLMASCQREYCRLISEGENFGVNS